MAKIDHSHRTTSNKRRILQEHVFKARRKGIFGKCHDFVTEIIKKCLDFVTKITKKCLDFVIEV